MTSNPETAGTPPRPGLGTLFRRLGRDAALLVRQEAALAQAETRENVGRIARGTVRVVVGGFLLLTGLLFLLLAGNHGIGVGLEAAGVSPATARWLAPLLLGAAVVGAGAVALGAGLRAFRRATLTPEKTLETLKETKRWIAGRNP